MYLHRAVIFSVALLLLATATAAANCNINSRSTVDQDISAVFSCFWRRHVAVRANYKIASKARWQSRAGYSPLKPLLSDITSMKSLRSRANALHRSFIDLLGQFDPRMGSHERWSTEHKMHRDEFLNQMVRNNMTQEFLSVFGKLGYIKKAETNLNSFRNFLNVTWFHPYARRRASHQQGIRDSSGFEHVFAGEYDEEKVSGFHNWIQLLKLEEENKLEYLGYFEKSDKVQGASLRIRWSGKLKGGSSLFVGTPPEFEMLLYTACFMFKKNQKCHINLAGQDLTITNYDVGWQRNQLATAYFSLPRSSVKSFMVRLVDRILN